MATIETLDLRSIEELAGFQACAELQRVTWGDDFAELVPPSLLMVCQKIGGLVAGAFGPGHELLGFVFGMAGFREDRPIHWSHMLAVRPDARGRGLGRGLKLHQRRTLLERGTDVAFWTFDPLVSRNAHLNLNRLGAVVAGYERDLYGTETNSPLHGLGGTDRFVVRWDLRSQRVRRAVDGEIPVDAADYRDAPVVTLPERRGDGRHGDDSPFQPPFPFEPRVLVEIPRDVQALKRGDPDRVVRWRSLTGAALPWYLGRGYTVEGLLPAPDGEHSRYALRTRGDEPDGREGATPEGREGPDRDD